MQNNNSNNILLTEDPISTKENWIILLDNFGNAKGKREIEFINFTEHNVKLKKTFNLEFENSTSILF
jgi:hypothetical protein